MITIIAAVTLDNGLGKGGDLLYHISDDLRHFKQVTMGHAIVMGRKTFESFPKGPLPGRRNIVISHNKNFTATGADVYPSLADAVNATGKDCFIIGGGSVYREAMTMANELLITHIDLPSPAGTDTFFPPIDSQEWVAVENSGSKTDAKTGIPYHIVTYRRR